MANSNLNKSKFRVAGFVPGQKPSRLSGVQKAKKRIAILGFIKRNRRVSKPRRPRSALELAGELLADPGPWLRTPNSQFDNRAPIDLIGTDEEVKVRDILSAYDQGLFG